jgi:uncharacterized sulfatase
VERPNIIFVFSDQQRWDTCGCYGQPLPTTPNLDSMAEQGTLFKNTFSCQPVCGPARACIQTGRYPTEIDCHTNNKMLPADEQTIAKILSAEGYETAYIGKWHLASKGKSGGPDDFKTQPVPPERRGGYQDFWLASDLLEFTSHGYDGYMFDGDMNRRDFPDGRYRVDVQTDWAIEYLNNRNTDNPFFLFISYIEPHHQNDHNHYEGPNGSKDRYRDFVVPGDLEGTEGDWREEYPDYLGCIHSLDENVGRLRSELEKLGIADNTVVIYTSDHGSHFRTRNNEYKRSCHESSIRIPFIACGPGFAGGNVVDDLVSTIDFAPTMLRAAGIDTPGTMSGNPLQNLVNGTAANRPEDVFIQISESQCGRALRTGKWKYSVSAPDVNGVKVSAHDVYVEEFLYDLKNDPHERTNLVASPDHAEVRAELRERLKQRIGEAEKQIPEIRPIG